MSIENFYLTRNNKCLKKVLLGHIKKRRLDCLIVLDDSEFGYCLNWVLVQLCGSVACWGSRIRRVGSLRQASQCRAG